MLRAKKWVAVVVAVVAALIVAPVTASASEVVFIDRASEADATFTAVSNGVTVQIEVVATTITGISKGAPAQFTRTLVFASLTDLTGQQIDFLSGSPFVGPTIAPNLNGATFGPTSVDLQSFFGCCTAQTVNLGVVWTPVAATVHSHMVNFFCPPGVCFGMFNLVGDSRPATATLTASGLVDGIDLSQAIFTATSAVMQTSTGVGVFG